VKIGSMIVALIVACILAGNTLANSSDLPPLVDVLQKQFRESPGSAQISATTLPGLVAAPFEARVLKSPSIITVSGITVRKGVICVQIGSANNLYRAEFTVPAPAKGSTVSFSMPSNNLSQAADVVGAIFVRAQQSAARKCSDDSPYLPIVWGRSKPSGDLWLAVNSNATSVRVRPSSRLEVSSCKRLGDFSAMNDVNPSRFQFLCKVSVPATCKGDTEFTVTFTDANGPRKPAIRKVANVC